MIVVIIGGDVKSKYHVTKFGINGLTLTPIFYYKLLHDTIFGNGFERWLRGEE